MSTPGLLLLGLVVGVLSAMLGIGGGIVLVPALVLVFGLTQAEAQGTSLATIPFGAVVAALLYNQSAPLRLNVVVVLAAGIVAGAYLGARAAPLVNEAALRLAFGGLLLYLGLLFVFDLQPSNPAGLMLIPVTAAMAWVRRRRRPPTEPPAGPHEYYI
ncbi:MAG: sulfite exporter TauE/SafE family protein [Gemmataceae bacterium]|nr:sulfite exporter TauE/SafE family protein [Gemmataceae bacterium]